MTIEERAKEAYYVDFDGVEDYRKCYIKGATEQKAIDDEQLPLIKETYYNAGYETAKNKMIDKACEWLSERCAFGVHPCGGTALVMEFRKVMEE